MLSPAGMSIKSLTFSSSQAASDQELVVNLMKCGASLAVRRTAGKG